MATTITVGKAQVTSLTDLAAAEPVGGVYYQVNDAQFAHYADLLEPDGQILINFTCYLVRVDGKTILIDTAYGPPREGKLMEEIAAAGAKPEDIDVVTYSHLHGDHYGWSLIKEGDSYKPRFPNARYLVSQVDWDFFYTNFPRNDQPESAAYFDEWMAPIQHMGVMDMIGGGHVFTPSFVSEHTPGHTPGHLSFVLKSGGETCFFLGDVAFTPLDAAEPSWKTVWDEDQDLAIKTRYEVLDRLAGDETLVAGNHFPRPTYGYFTRERGKYGWRPRD